MYHCIAISATHYIREYEINEITGTYMSRWEPLSSPETGLKESLGE